jgi:hypothetical protein
MVDAISPSIVLEAVEMAKVYFFRSAEEDRFKIGLTRGDVEKRRKSLSTGNPNPLVEFARVETENASATETFAHRWIESRKCVGDAREFYALTESEAEAHVQRTTDFAKRDLPRRQSVAQLAKEESDGRQLAPGEREWDLYHQLLRVREEQYRLSIVEQRIEDDLKLAMGTAAEITGIATWRTESRMTFVTKEFRVKHDDLYREFLRESRSRKFKPM